MKLYIKEKESRRNVYAESNTVLNSENFESEEELVRKLYRDYEEKYFQVTIKPHHFDNIYQAKIEEEKGKIKVVVFNDNELWKADIEPQSKPQGATTRYSKTEKITDQGDENSWL